MKTTKAVAKITICLLLVLATVLTAYANPAQPPKPQPEPQPQQPANPQPQPTNPNQNPPNPNAPNPNLPGIGDPIGLVVWTDITAYINGNQIPMSNIEGYAHVVVEDLQYYGFDVTWNAVDRTLKVERNKNKTMQPLAVEKIPLGKRPGDVKAYYVQSAIRVYLSGELVTSYSINGYMFIDFELLKKYGTVSWNNATRKLTCELN